MDQLKKIPGGRHSDNRGIIRYNNSLDLGPAKRFHIIEHPNTDIFRGWQGHRKEQKWFQSLNGSFSILVVKPDNWESPSIYLKVEEFILAADDNHVLHIPGGYVTGIKALKPHSQLAVFSSLDLDSSLADSYKFDAELWQTQP